MEIGEVGIPVDGHQQIRFSQNASQHVNDTLNATQRETIRIRPTNADSRRTEGQSLYNVCPGAYPGVKQDGRVARGLDDARQQVHRRDAAVLPDDRHDLNSRCHRHLRRSRAAHRRDDKYPSE
jgi:hypothetical protein